MIDIIRSLNKKFRNNIDEELEVSQNIDKTKEIIEPMEKTEEVIEKTENLVDTEEKVFYLKLTILEHQKYIGKRVKLFEKGKLIWGIELERPQVGFPLEYRNIIVNSNDPKDFMLDIDIPNKIEINTKSFTTREQIIYDRRFNVIQDNGFFYSIRGNVENPNKIIFTFPGFGPSTSRISYSVSAFQNIDSTVTENALIIAFQDRYHTAGTYMIEDNFGEKLYPKFIELVDNIKKKYGLENKDLLFFGASKGGSIALMYMKEFKESTLLISAPQVELLYYWQSKAFFRNNLFHYFKNRIDGDLIKLLNQYLNENRKIHYFYTHNDELSNYNFIETINGFSQLHKYQVDGKHGEITKKAQATMENIIINFVSNNKNRELKKAVISKYIEKDKKIYFQIVMDKELNEINNIESNKYVVFNEYGTKHYIYLTNHIRNNVAYSNEMQYLDLNLTSISTNDILATYYNKNGDFFEYEIEEHNLKLKSEQKLKDNLIKLESSIAMSYIVVEKDITNEFNYIYFDNSPDRFLNIKFVDSLPTNSSLSEKIIYILKSESIDNINIFISRIIKILKISNLNIILEKEEFEYLFYINNLDFPNLTFELIDPSFDIDNLIAKLTNKELDKFEKIYNLNKCIIKFNNSTPNQYFKKLLS